ncbi:MAG: hypothetical protein AB1742_00090 [bacterium]
MRKIALLIVAGFYFHAFLTGVTSSAHGVNYEIKNRKGVVIRIAYDDGKPMSYAAVKIFSHSDKKLEYQNGRTDKNGCFVFLPDEVGAWKITVDDGAGHGIIRTINVNEAARVEAICKGLPRWYKLIVGVSILLGAGGVLSYLSARRKPG